MPLSPCATRESQFRLNITPTRLPDVLLIAPTRHGDARGFFMESFRHDVFSSHVPGVTFVQDNHSLSEAAGTVRGLHFQRAPHAQGKLLRVTAGAVLDVAVDARASSPTYGQHVAVELSATNALQLWVPPGFLHGFCTLEPSTEVQYKVTDYYSAAHDGAVSWNDPELGIVWPTIANGALLSAKDAKAPRLRDLGVLFPAGSLPK
jgi:dTDP-4-dehydrorhamnose 3,5-epimerase